MIYHGLDYGDTCLQGSFMGFIQGDTSMLPWVRARLSSRVALNPKAKTSNPKRRALDPSEACRSFKSGPDFGYRWWLAENNILPM